MRCVELIALFSLRQVEWSRTTTKLFVASVIAFYV